MEEILEEMKVSESMQASLCKAYETLRSEASSMLTLSFQWKVLVDHFESTRSSLAAMAAELAEKEKSVAARESELAIKGSAVSSEIESKSSRLAGIETKSLAELDERELAVKDSAVSSVMESKSSLLAGIETMIETKTKSLGEVEKLIEARKLEAESIHSAVRVKCEELEVVEQWMFEKSRKCDELKDEINERTKRLDYLERSSRQRTAKVESLGKELSFVREMLSKCREDFDFVRVSLRDHEDQLIVCRNSVEEFDDEIGLKGEVLRSIQDSVGKCSLELDSKKTQLDSLRREFDFKKKMFVSLKKSVDEWDRKFDAKERELEGLVRRVHEANPQSLGPEFDEVHLIHAKVNECLKEAETKEKSLVSFQKSLEERSIELEKRERDFEERFQQFALRQKELDSIQNTTDSGAKEKTNTPCSAVKIEQPENKQIVASLPSSASHEKYTTNGRLLQLLVAKELNSHNSRCEELLDIVHKSADPAKLIIDAVKGFYPLHSSGGKEDSVYDWGTLKASCLFLLEKLTFVPLRISPQVREEAKNLASDWKTKIEAGIESRFDVPVFVQLLKCYDLSSDFDGFEVRHLVELDQKFQQAPLPLCLADEATTPVNADQAENLTDVNSSSPNLIGKVLTQDDILVALQQPDPAKYVLGMVKESFSRLWNRGDRVGSEVCFLKSYIFMFEQLLRNSPEIKKDIREHAMKLAEEWGTRIRSNEIESCLEALGFLLFLAVYGLVSLVTEDNLTSFLEIISRDSLVLEQSQNLGLAYKIEDTLTEDVFGKPRESISRVAVYVQNLVGKKKHIVAVRLACAFKLKDKFSLAKLLNEYVEEAKICSRQLGQETKSVEEKDKATDLEIAALTDVVQCVMDLNLKSEFPLDNVAKRIALLKKIKMDRMHSAVFFGESNEQQQQISNKPKTYTASPSKEQQQQQISNKPKTNTASPSNEQQKMPSKGKTKTASPSIEQQQQIPNKGKTKTASPSNEQQQQISKKRKLPGK